MKVDIKDVLELTLINLKHEIQNNINMEDLNGYISAVNDLLQLPIFNEFPEIQNYRNRLTTQILEINNQKEQTE